MIDKKKLIGCIIFDGMQNSVFQSMVLTPLLLTLEKNPHHKIIIISFEYKFINNATITNIITDKKITLIQGIKNHFYGKLSLKNQVNFIKKILLQYHFDELITRGPIATWITKQAIKKILPMVQNQKKLPSLIIQARGLCAEEYRYAHIKNESNPFLKLCRKIAYKSLRRIEKEAYSIQISYIQSIIQAVSPALAEYLIKHFGCVSDFITITNNDYILPVNKQCIVEWRTQKRSNLNIPNNAFVFCYSGSYKPWQCINQTIDLFKKKYEENKYSFLLILSSDKELFTHFLKKHLPINTYSIHQASPKETLSYLATADVGFLLREDDIINWVSRPTKMLEYMALGLPIIHNETIAWLANPTKYSPAFFNALYDQFDAKELKTSQLSSAQHAN